MNRSLVGSRVPSSRQLLARVLDKPDLVRRVQEMSAPALGKLIERVGLEDAGEILAFATAGQLEQVFDEALWVSERAGEEERFDAARFALWLEVMLEGGARSAADRLAQLSEEFLVLAISSHVLVVDLDALAFEVERGDDEEADEIEHALESALSHEFDQYRVLSRRSTGWDTVLEALLALDEHHAALLRRVLERCCAASSDYIEDHGGLQRALSSEEMRLSDARAARDDRRAALGFVAPSDARAFLALIDQTTIVELLTSTAQDPVTRAYFRELTRPDQRVSRKRSPKPTLTGPTGHAVPALGSELASRGGSGSLFQRALHRLREDDEDAHGARMEELAYLANVLLAAARESGRSVRPVEAIRRAVAHCERGLEHRLRAASREPSPSEALRVLRSEGADKLFRIGWRLREDGSPGGALSGPMKLG